MNEIWHAIEYMCYGFIAGAFARPAWNLAKRIKEEFNLAREEWSQPQRHNRKDYE